MPLYDPNAEPIDSFRNKYAFLSNFYPWAGGGRRIGRNIRILYDGRYYRSSEHAFQAAKTLDLRARAHIRHQPTPGSAKRHGQKVVLRPDWEKVKARIMYAIIFDKFTRNPMLADKLLQTRRAQLIEGNTWGDTYWGVCRGEGQNLFGKILMSVRRRIALTFVPF